MADFEVVTQSFDDWMLAIEALDDPVSALAKVNKTRRAAFHIRVNGMDYFVPRADVKQFLEDIINN